VLTHATAKDATSTGARRETEPASKSSQQSAHEPAPWVSSLLASIGDPQGRGSNNWAVPGTLTRSGKPLLANDPHLELGAPSVWYMVSLKAPDLQVAGATIPGLPFVV